MIESREDLQEQVYLRLGEAKDLLAGDDYFDPEHEVGLAVETAIQELALAFPLSNPIFEYWAVERGKRHSYDIIRSSAATKFRYKQIHMQQRFIHFNALIERMDADYAYALETNAELMKSDSQFFITYIKAGFIYDEFGRDITHEVD
ncbi:MAG: hypothetical protein ACOCZ4_00355 [Bacteroidota bacterium]